MIGAQNAIRALRPGKLDIKWLSWQTVYSFNLGAYFKVKTSTIAATLGLHLLVGVLEMLECAHQEIIFSDVKLE